MLRINSCDEESALLFFDAAKSRSFAFAQDDS
jgi:hypothetical protein